MTKDEIKIMVDERIAALVEPYARRGTPEREILVHVIQHDTPRKSEMREAISALKKVKEISAEANEAIGAARKAAAASRKCAEELRKQLDAVKPEFPSEPEATREVPTDAK